MPEPLRVLTSNDLRVLKEAIAYQKQQRVAPARRKQDPDPDFPPVNLFLALTPGGGIAARSGTTVGNATCTLYRRRGTTIESIGKTAAVYNLASSAMPGSSYIMTWQDRYGTWWVGGVEGGGGSATGGGVGIPSLPSYVDDMIYFSLDPISYASTEVFMYAADTLHACPFWIREDVSLDRFDIRHGTVPVVGDSKVRVGLYTNKSGDFYPDAKLLDSGEILLGSGGSPVAVPAQASVSLDIDGNQWIWLVTNANAAATGGSPVQTIYGWDENNTQLASGAFTGMYWRSAGTLFEFPFGHYHSQAYGALPSTFPDTSRGLGTTVGRFIPAIGLHFA